MASSSSSELTDEQWLALLSRQYAPAGEEVIFVKRLKAYTLTVPQVDMRRCFGRFTGIQLESGKRVSITATSTGTRVIDLPGWVIRQLGLDAGDHVCFTRAKRDGSVALRRFRLAAGQTRVPGRVIIDHFTDTNVTRTHYSRTDIDAITKHQVKDLADRMGKLKYDPLRSFDDVGGRLGFLFRSEIRGPLTNEDESFVESYRRRILSTQQADGGWNDNMVETAFNLIRLIETGTGTRNPAVTRAVRWLLSASQPSGLPGLFMATVGLTEEFNEWKDDPGGVGMPEAPGYMSDVAQLYREVNQRGSRSSRYQSVRDVYRDNTEVVPGVCELALTSSSAVVLEALIRLGFWDERRVRTAINTLISLWSGRWCGCGYLGHGRRISADDGPVDFNRLHIPSTNGTIYRLDWFTNEKEIAQIVGCRRASPHYSWLGLGRNEAIIDKASVGMGDCTLGVHEALSYHPDYAGSNLEAIAALEFSRRQSPLGSWGNTSVSTMLNSLGRLSHPLAAFLVLRTIPSLIREQRPSGLWVEGNEVEAHAHYLPSLRILRALKRFDLLTPLLPTN